MRKNNDTSSAEEYKVMYIDMAYTLKMVQDRQLEQELASRQSGGYFKHVWGVHPMADVPENRMLKYEGFKPLVAKFSESQTIVEGLSAYYSGLKKIFPLNFLVSQIRFTTYLIKLINREKISIVLATDPYYSGLMGLLLKLFTRARLVIWVVANNDDIYKATGIPAMPRLFKWRWVEKIVERIVFRSADLVAGGNQNNLEFALRNGAIEKRSTVFPVGKLIHTQHLQEPYLREIDQFFETVKAENYFVYIGRLTEVKHPDDVIRAFALIQQSLPESVLLMAGDGPMMDGLEILSKEQKIEKKIHFLGNVSQHRLANLLARCSVVLSPLTGRSLVESALAGLPIVAYDRDWQVDFVEKNGSGIIVPFRNWKKMAEAAIRIIKDPDEKFRMSLASRKAGLEIADTQKLFEHEWEEFDKLLQIK